MRCLKNKVLNIVIIVLVVGCLILGGKIGYDYYMGECEIYNDNIVNFTIEMIKGNKSLEDVDSLDAMEEVKESLRQYYNDTFYSDDDLIVLYDDYNYVLKNKDDIAESQKEYGESILDEGCAYFLGSLSEDDTYTDEEMRYFELKSIYIDILKNEIDERVFEKDNQICIKVKDLQFKNSIDIIIYKGLKFKVFEDSMIKDIPNYRQTSEKFQTFELVQDIKESDILKYNFKNILADKLLIVGKISFGKIKNIEIQEQF